MELSYSILTPHKIIRNKYVPCSWTMCVLQTTKLWLCWCKWDSVTVMWSATKRAGDTFSIMPPVFLFVLANVHNQQSTDNLPGTIQCFLGHTVKLICPISWRAATVFMQTYFYRVFITAHFSLKSFLRFHPFWIEWTQSIVTRMGWPVSCRWEKFVQTFLFWWTRSVVRCFSMPFELWLSS